MSVDRAVELEPRSVAEVPTAPGADAGVSRGGRFRVQRLLRNRLSVIGFALLAIVVLLVLIGPLVWRADPTQQHLSEAVAHPSAAHPLGTDTNGRDVLARILHGGRMSIALALGAVLMATVVGTLIGLSAGFIGGPLDSVFMRLMDVLLAFPALLLALAIVAAAGPGPMNTAIAVGVPSIPYFARLTRSMVVSIREREFVLAARAAGVRRWRIMTRHVLGNSLSPVIVNMALAFGLTLLEVAGLGFLGLGVQPPDAEWGAMLSDGREYLLTSPIVLIAPGLAIVLTAVAVNIVGDAMNDALEASS